MRPGIAVMLVVLHGCFVLAAVLGAQGLVTILRRSRAEHHQALLVGAAPSVAAIIPAVGLGWFVWQGPGDLTEQRGHRHPGVHDRRLDRAPTPTGSW